MTPAILAADGAVVPTVAVATSIGRHAGVSADVVHAITAAVCDHAGP